MATSSAASSTQKQLKNAETEIAVLQVQFKNLDGKVDDLKEDLKDVRENIVSTTESTHELLKSFQETNDQSHRDLTLKISAIEKWRWMMMGAGVVIGALGWPILATVIGM